MKGFTCEILINLLWMPWCCCGIKSGLTVILPVRCAIFILKQNLVSLHSRWQMVHFRSFWRSWLSGWVLLYLLHYNKICSYWNLITGSDDWYADKFDNILMIYSNSLRFQHVEISIWDHNPPIISCNKKVVTKYNVSRAVPFYLVYVTFFAKNFELIVRNLY